MSTTKFISPEKRDIQQYFNEIAERYDFLNSFLSFRQDERWRIKSRNHVLKREHNRILDLGTGTGKFLQSFLDSKKWELAVALDFSSQMLLRAKETMSTGVDFVSADFHELPFLDRSFDLVISAFALRSVKNMHKFLNEIRRVLMPGGSVALLCLTRPENPVCKIFYYPYLKFYLPVVGTLFSGQKEAYRFLSDSIQHFQDPRKTMVMMEEVGYHHLTLRSFTMGTVTLLTGVT